MKRRSPAAAALRSKIFKHRVVRPKRGRGSYRRKKHATDHD